MGAATLLSRLLGMVREMVYARFMGDGLVASAFFYAFQIPNLFRRLLGEGALTAAFIPMFKEKEMQEGEKAMWYVANATVSALIIACSIAVTLIIIFSTAMIEGVNLGLKTQLFFGLLRIMAPYVLMVCVAAVLMGILNARGHFFIPALGATMLNVVMIAAVLSYCAKVWDASRRQDLWLGGRHLDCRSCSNALPIPSPFQGRLQASMDQSMEERNRP